MRRIAGLGVFMVSAWLAGASPSRAAPSLPPVARTGPELQVVASFGDDFRLVGIGVSQAGRVFASAPANDVRSRDSLVEVDPQSGKVSPYPNAQWNRFSTSPVHPQWINVQALWVDENDHLWVLDSSLPKLDQKHLPPKLVEFDLRDNHVIRQYDFANVVAPPDALNDVRIDTSHGFAYLTNAGNKGSLVVLDLATGAARQVLVADRSTRADPAEHLMLADGPAHKHDGSVVAIHADGIALSPDSEWLYYRPLTDHHYWRIPTAALRDPALDAHALSAQVQALGDGVLSGGLIIDRNGTLIGGDLEHRTIVAMTIAGAPARIHEHVLASDPNLLSWADGFALRGDELYVADSRLWEVALKNAYARSGRFAIYKLRIPAGE